MPIVIPRNPESGSVSPAVTPEQRDALWAAFVTSWLDKNKDQFAELLTQPETNPAGCL